MTKALPRGTENFAMNFLKEELALIRREAHDADIPIKEYFMRRFRRGVALTDRETAKKLAAMSRHRLIVRTAKATAKAGTSLALAVLMGLAGSDARYLRGRRTREDGVEAGVEVWA